jgi:hypothetical protein
VKPSAPSATGYQQDPYDFLRKRLRMVLHYHRGNSEDDFLPEGEIVKVPS